jgi:branched-chain amino acid transport system ATP-binding protein
MSLLAVEGVSVRFGGVRALTDVSLTIDNGQIVGLIGPNGAGKTTLLGVVSGLQACKPGRVTFQGSDITGLPPHRRARLGISRTFQRLELWNSMVARALASNPDLVLLDEPSAGLDTKESAALAEVLREVNAGGTAILLVEHHVEMVMALCAKVVVLDFGQVIGSGAPAEVRQLPEVQNAYLGAAL